MNLLNLPLELFDKLFGQGAIFSNWVSFFIANWMALALGGYILSKWMSKDPQGLIDRNQLSSKITQEATWYAPLAIVAVALSVIYNVVIYALFLLLEVTTFVTNFVYKYVSIAVLWFWNEVFKPSVWLSIKLVYHYLVKWPFQMLITIINTVPTTLHRSLYMKVFWPTLIGSIGAGLLAFIGVYFHHSTLTNYGPLFSLTLALSWVVASTIYQTREAAIKSLRFAIVFMLLLVGLFAIGKLLNFTDGAIKWGGTLTGLLHAPSVVSAIILILSVLSLLYLSNVGVLFANDETETKWTERIYNYIKLAFKHSLTFIYQPLLVLFVSAVVVIIPWTLIDQGSQFAREYWVDTRLNEKNQDLRSELEKNNMLSQMDRLIDPEITKDADFEKALIALQKEISLTADLEENERYMDYIHQAQEVGSIDLNAMISSDEFEAKISADSLALSQLREKRKTQNTSYQEQITSLDDRILDINATINSNPEFADLYLPIRNELKTQSKALGALKERYNRFMEVLINGTKKQHANYSRNWTSYSLTYLFFILANYALLAIVISFVFNLYAHTVKPFYDAHTGSHLAASIAMERSRNAHQPWLAWLVLAVLIVIYFQWNSLNAATTDELSRIFGVLEEWSSKLVP